MEKFVKALETAGGNLLVLIFLIVLFLSASIYQVPNSSEILWAIVGGLLSAIKSKADHNPEK